MSAADTLAAAIGRLPVTEVAVALHTADPGESGDMTINEAAYTGYARVDVALPPGRRIDFPTGSGGSGRVTHYSVGATGGGAAKIFFSGPVTPPFMTGDGLTPHLSTA